MIKSYKDLDVWQQAFTLADHIYTVTASFPKEEVFGLVMQMWRSAASIPANIAEGSVRNSKKDFAHFIGIARGSLAELETHTLLAFRRNFIHHSDYIKLEKQMDIISRMLMGLRRSLLVTNKAQGTRHKALA